MSLLINNTFGQMETVKPIVTCSVQFRREKYKTNLNARSLHKHIGDIRVDLN